MPTIGTSWRSPSSPRGAACPSVRVHALLDGRDTPPRSAIDFLPDLEGRLAAAHPDARIASVGGRYFAMDRDRRWDRIEAGYDAIVHGVGDHAASASEALAAAYARGENDEFVRPTVIDGIDGHGSRDGDVIIHLNFRADRARQLTHALADPIFEGFDRAAPDGSPAPRGLQVVTMTEYEAGLPGRRRLPARGGTLPRPGGLGGRLAAAPRRRDREVRPRHVLLQRRARGALPGRGADPHPEPQGRDLRPPAGDERAGRHRRAGRRDRLAAASTSSSPTTPTRTWSATPASGTATLEALAVIDACLGRVVGGDRGGRGGGSRPARGRCSPSPPTTATPTRCATRAARPVTAHSLNPVPFVLVGRAAVGRAPPRRRPGRRRADAPGASSACSPLGRRDRPIAPRGLTRREAPEDPVLRSVADYAGGPVP